MGSVLVIGAVVVSSLLWARLDNKLSASRCLAWFAWARSGSPMII
jgi:hypothetical protein